MSTDDDKAAPIEVTENPSLTDRVSEAAQEASARAREEAAAAAGRAAAKGFMAGMSRAANGFLDAVERSVFGKVGGADEVLAREEGVDPLERIRGEAAAAPPPPKRPTAAEREAKAMEELRALKARRDGGEG